MTCIMLACSGCGTDPSLHDPVSELETEFAADPAESEPEGLFVVVDAAGPLVVVERSADPGWGEGPVRLVTPSHPTRWLISERAIEPLRVPSELAALSGLQVVLHGEHGELCRAELGDLELVRRSDPDELHAQQPPLTDVDALTARAWNAVASRLVLGSRPRAISGNCAGAIFATLTDAPAPERFVPRSGPELTARLESEALAAFRELGSHAEIQTSYALDLPVIAPEEPRAALWDQHRGAAPEVALWSSAERTLISVRAAIGEPGSCELGASLWAVFGAGEQGLERLADSSIEPYPELLLDVGRDGTLEMFAAERLLIPTADGVRAFDTDVPSYGCGC